jgi:hypothetical protein
MNETERATECGQAMLRVVEEVYNGGKTFIPNWSGTVRSRSGYGRAGWRSVAGSPEGKGSDVSGPAR